MINPIPLSPLKFLETSKWDLPFCIPAFCQNKYENSKVSFSFLRSIAVAFASELSLFTFLREILVSRTFYVPRARSFSARFWGKSRH
jgi:hypothetical protein